MPLSVNEKIAEQLSGIAPIVEERVVNLIVEKEVSRRSEMITQGLTKLEELQKEKKRADKPDVENYDGEGNPLPPVFSKAKTEERKKLDDKISKFENALNKAITGDIGDIANLVQQK